MVCIRKISEVRCIVIFIVVVVFVASSERERSSRIAPLEVPPSADAEEAGKGTSQAVPTMAADWEAYTDDRGRTYYHNAELGKTQWDFPAVKSAEEGKGRKKVRKLPYRYPFTHASVLRGCGCKVPPNSALCFQYALQEFSIPLSNSYCKNSTLRFPIHGSTNQR